MMRVLRLGPVFLVVVLLAGCSGDETAVGPVKMPTKESTWVQTEKVSTTKEEALSGAKRVLSEISIDEKLVQKLQASNSSATTGVVVDRDTCLKQANVLDQRRVAVQKTGGAWTAFERHPELKPYSANGMQLDSNINKMVFALNYLCKTAKGVPLNPLAQVVVAQIESTGKEATEEKMLSLGKNKTDTKKWIEYAEFAKANESREVPYAAVEQLIGHTAPLIELYEDLAQRPVDDNSLPAFLSDAVTLLHVIKGQLDNDQYMTLALKEDTAIPYENLNRGDM